ncbi:MAG TPA: helix-turn-helix transcriptional regulator [Anaerolineales bacterium]|nr:helix-turn-helix transcriptional regulator [Anaerolineales bacterium]
MAERQSVLLRTKMLGALIRQARMTAGKSLKETAALIGTTSGVLSSYEKGRRGISLPELELLAFYLGMPLRSLTSSSKAEARKKAEFNPAVMVSLRQHFIGAMLKTLRTEAGLSLRQLAKAVGLSSARLAAYEQGERPIPLAELEQLANVLNRGVKVFMDARGPIGEWESTQEEFEDFQRLPADIRDFMRNPNSEVYLRMALRLSELSTDKLRTLGEGLLELTL